jgi:sialate O-acetylesterase
MCPNNKKNMSKSIKLLLPLFLMIKTTGFSQIKLPRLISDGMVLQCEKPLKLWGWASD